MNKLFRPLSQIVEELEELSDPCGYNLEFRGSYEASTAHGEIVCYGDIIVIVLTELCEKLKEKRMKEGII